MNNLFISNGGESFWYAVGNNSCTKCNSPLLDMGFFVCRWERKQVSKTLYFCNVCITSHKKYTLSDFPSVQVVVGNCSFVSERPKGVRVYIPLYPEFTGGKMGITVYDVDKISSDYVDDLTKLSGKNHLCLGVDKNKEIGGKID